MSTPPRKKGKHQHDATSPENILLSRQTLRGRWECSNETIRRRERDGQLHPVILSGKMLRYRLSEVLAAESNANATRYIPKCGYKPQASDADSAQTLPIPVRGAPGQKTRSTA